MQKEEKIRYRYFGFRIKLPAFIILLQQRKLHQTLVYLVSFRASDEFPESNSKLFKGFPYFNSFSRAFYSF